MKTSSEKNVQKGGNGSHFFSPLPPFAIRQFLNVKKSN